MAEGHEQDLPLMANTSDILVRHFLLDLHCDLQAKVMSGSIILFLDPIGLQEDGQKLRIFSLQDYEHHIRSSKFTVACTKGGQNLQREPLKNEGKVDHLQMEGDTSGVSQEESCQLVIGPSADSDLPQHVQMMNQPQSQQICCPESGQRVMGHSSATQQHSPPFSTGSPDLHKPHEKSMHASHLNQVHQNAMCLSHSTQSCNTPGWSETSYLSSGNLSDMSSQCSTNTSETDKGARNIDAALLNFDAQNRQGSEMEPATSLLAQPESKYDKWTVFIDSQVPHQSDSNSGSRRYAFVDYSYSSMCIPQGDAYTGGPRDTCAPWSSVVQEGQTSSEVKHSLSSSCMQQTVPVTGVNTIPGVKEAISASNMQHTESVNDAKTNDRLGHEVVTGNLFSMGMEQCVPLNTVGGIFGERTAESLSNVHQNIPVLDEARPEVMHETASGKTTYQNTSAIKGRCHNIDESYQSVHDSSETWQSVKSEGESCNEMRDSSPSYPANKTVSPCTRDQSSVSVNVSTEIRTGSPGGTVDQSDEVGLFECILDCCDVHVHSVEELHLDYGLQEELCEAWCGDFSSLKELYAKCRTCSCSGLGYKVDKWCVRVHKPGVLAVHDFPRVIKVNYSTDPSGTSLRWTVDQDGRPCMYTSAMWINNRAFFPCQEYASLCTWQAYITVAQGALVLMSGDHDEICTPVDNTGTLCYYYECGMPLPSFTLAIAVGSWDHAVLTPIQGQVNQPISLPKEDESRCSHTPPCWIHYSSQPVIPCRLFAPASLLEKARAEFQDYFAQCSIAVQQVLGAHPFSRVDIVLYPACSHDMAMANPNLIFLAQSLVSGDGSMCIRLSHELSHSWFGLLLGAKDWTEEWLSEGFATFVEDSIHAKAMQWTEKESRDHAELRAVLRYRTLEAEMENTRESVQTLRPNQGKSCEEDQSSVMYVKNGLNPEKLFTQVHYLKGYFLLRYLAGLGGEARFLVVLKTYIGQYHGQFVLSQDFLGLVFLTFPELREQGLSLEQIYHNWLDCPGMPQFLCGYTPSADNELYNTVLQQVTMWREFNQLKQRQKRSTKKRRVEKKHDFTALEPDQLVLLLELLLEEGTMATATLTKLKDIYKLSVQNADVRHRWCELVVKHKYSRGYEDIRHFLIHDQAMGVYLYGEMVLSGCRKQRSLAEECFQLTGPHMEATTHKTVRAMLYGTTS